MSDPLLRGAVVLYDGRFSVVWDVRVDGLVLLPIIQPRKRLAIDVALELAELLACGVPMHGAVVRPRRNPPVGGGGHSVVGTVPGAAMCRVVQGVIRAAADEANHRKWADEARQKMHNAGERCVNLVA